MIELFKLTGRVTSRFFIFIFGLVIAVESHATTKSLLDSSVTIFTDVGSGSGVVVSSEGVIFTNQHVIDEAQSVAVRLHNGDVYSQVDLVAVDELRDIAVLKISGFDLTVASLGNSNSIEVGDSVSVVGAPRGFSGTLTSGVVSAKRRLNGVELIQIDAAISPGSSGGAVFNAEGEVVALAVSQFEDGQNLNFAIPINYARGLPVTGDSLSTFSSGENLLLAYEQSALNAPVVAGNSMSQSDVLEVAALSLGIDLQGPDEDGFYVAQREQGEGDVWLYFEGDTVEVTIFWGMGSVRLDKDLLTDLLRANFKTSRINIGLYDREDGVLAMGIGFESKIQWLEPRELAAAIDELTRVDREVFSFVTANIPENADDEFLNSESRPSFARAKKASKAKTYSVMRDSFKLQLSKSWKVVADNEIPSSGGRRRQFSERNGTAEVLLLEEFSNQRVENKLVASLAVKLAKSEGGDYGEYLELARGVRQVGDLEVVWISVVQQRPGQLPIFFEFNVFVDVTDLLTLLVAGEGLEEVRNLGTEIIRTLR